MRQGVRVVSSIEFSSVFLRESPRRPLRLSDFQKHLPQRDSRGLRRDRRGRRKNLAGQRCFKRRLVIECASSPWIKLPETFVPLARGTNRIAERNNRDEDPVQWTKSWFVAVSRTEFSDDDPWPTSG